MDTDQEIDFLEIRRTLMRHKGWVLGTPLFFAVTALIASFFVHPQWEAQALIDPGRRGTIEGKPELLDSVTDVTDEMRSSNFKASVLAKLSIDSKDPRAGLYSKTLKVTNLGGSTLIKLMVRGYSREEALRWAQASSEHLSEIQQKQIDAEIKLFSLAAHQLDKSVNRIETNISGAELTMRGNSRRLPNEDELAGSLIGKLSKALLADELLNAQKSRLFYAVRIDPALTHPAKLLDQVYVGDSPVYPRKLQLSAMAGICGLIAGVLVALCLGASEAGKPQER